MIMKRLDMRIIKEILRLKFDGKLSNRNIAKSLNISRGVVNNYLNICDSENIHWPLTENTENVLLNLLDNSKKGTATPPKEAVYADIIVNMKNIISEKKTFHCKKCFIKIGI